MVIAVIVLLTVECFVEAPPRSGATHRQIRAAEPGSTRPGNAVSARQRTSNAGPRYAVVGWRIQVSTSQDVAEIDCREAGTLPRPPATRPRPRRPRRRQRVAHRRRDDARGVDGSARSGTPRHRPIEQVGHRESGTTERGAAVESTTIVRSPAPPARGVSTSRSTASTTRSRRRSRSGPPTRGRPVGPTAASSPGCSTTCSASCSVSSGTGVHRRVEGSLRGGRRRYIVRCCAAVAWSACRVGS